MKAEEMLRRLDAGLSIPVPRGTCRVCLARVRLRVDGTVGRHMHWLFECGGTGLLPDEETGGT